MLKRSRAPPFFEMMDEHSGIYIEEIREEVEYKPEKTPSCYFRKNYHRIDYCEDCWAKDLCPDRSR